MHAVRYRARRTLRAPVRHLAAFRGRKTYSAMMRVKNEGEFLEISIRSILEVVEEVVVVDNMSDDDSPQIIAALAAADPRIKAYTYPHQIARQGEENARLAASPEGASSPRLLANYYNWCMERCTQPFIVKWDGDMVALPHMAESLERFRTSRDQLMFNTGTNVHPTMTHADVGEPTIESEPRVFFRRFARYAADFPPCEYLASPYLTSNRVATDTEPQFLHLVFLKSNPYLNYSAEEHERLRAEHLRDRPQGDPLDADALATLDRWGVTDR